MPNLANIKSQLDDIERHLTPVPGSIVTFGIPKGVPITTDKKTGSKFMQIPFNYPNGNKGVLAVIHISKDKWKPDEVIESITIKYK